MPKIRVLREIGKGSYGNVSLVQHTVTKKTYAVRSMQKTRVGERGEGTRVATEQAFLARFTTPFIVRLFRVEEDHEVVHHFLEPATGKDLYSVMRSAYEREPEDVFKHNRGRLALGSTTFYAANIVLALLQLAEHGVIHRDLKPESLLLARNGYLK